MGFLRALIMPTLAPKEDTLSGSAAPLMVAASNREATCKRENEGARMRFRHGFRIC